MLHHLILIIKNVTFLGLGEGPNDGINDSTGAAGKKIIINFGKANTILLQFTLQW